ncbi:hypothetical protein SAMN05444166_4166 [Singulisphaera sp. GP187]|uniref:DUF6094 domain-containing protein n=1 Tax=Singulisphaera sp. GP187 TaxID=1882752 RepID=UPI00092BB4AF|nr:DUF6094 domain-containing protein [Singulisphaera sp. GP187]SIO37105.1 hypothetical protein SAMN05444166_4166 [Singulisphaera sp. GP187]
MRLAAQAKAGFYPAHTMAIAELSKHLYCRSLDPAKKYDTINIIDPCAGKGLAIKQLADALAVPEEHVYSIELDSERSKDILKLMPMSNHIGPASFTGVQITGFSFGLAYVNPPFDSELGGGKREEQGFTEKATRLLGQKGILVLVCPFTALCGNGNFVEYIDAHYEDVAVYKFPDGEDEAGNLIRPYREIVVIGRKRKDVLPSEAAQNHGKLHQMEMRWRGYLSIESLPALGMVQPKGWNGSHPSYDREEDIRTWEIPLSWKPNVFRKTMFTDDELREAVADSPLNKQLKEVKIPPPNSPPLPLDKGHLGLILASGMLDGPVEGPYGVHVVRGSSHKVEYHNKEQSKSESNPDTGAVTTKDVYSERMITVIRVVEQNGVIQTFSNEPQDKVADGTEEVDE